MKSWQLCTSGVFIFFLIATAGALLFSAATYAIYLPVMSSEEKLINNNNEGLTLLDNKGEIFFRFYDAKNKEEVNIDSIPQSAIDALIISEDKNFYDHYGFSPDGIARSIYLNFKNGDIVYGGSTITQQLAKNTLLSPTKSFIRKFQEVVLAVAIESIYTKEEILEMYLNTAYFGEGAFGIEKAAQIYFGKNASDLTLSESSFIVALLPSPTTLSPFNGGIEEAYSRQDDILNKMQREKLISRSGYVKAKSEELNFAENTQDGNYIAPHFALAVRDQLIEEFGEDEIVRSGYVVTTTLDKDMQEKAENILSAHTGELAQGGAGNAAAVVIEPQTGAVKVMAGSINWENQTFGQYNMATAPRQTGSTFKPILYSKAFENGSITPATILSDKPTTYRLENCDYNCEYKPNNYDRRFRGNVTVRQALANSLNIPAVEVMNRVGVSSVMAATEDVGVEDLADNCPGYGLAVALGSCSISLLDMTNAYATFANNGEFVEAHIIDEIKSKDGKKVRFDEPEKHRAWSEQVSYIVTSILSDNDARKPTFGNLLTLSRPAAVKTGTTDSYKDAWTIGYTPDWTVGVWVGNNNNAPMNSITGSIGAAPIWRDLMNTYHEGLAVKEFEQPSNIVLASICNYRRGQSASESARTKEYFIKGTEPKCKTLPDNIAGMDNNASESGERRHEEFFGPEGIGGAPPPEFMRDEDKQEGDDD